ncbi:MAG: hypothetical protein PHH82_02250 [Candidatus ainarchaeum sp.]|nr:hypothetical protein [Candidatus ainarchaeum sp.]
MDIRNLYLLVHPLFGLYIGKLESQKIITRYELDGYNKKQTVRHLLS